MKPGEKIFIKHIETGERFERWPVDAQELIRTGAFVRDIGDPNAPGRTEDQGPAVSVRGPDGQPLSAVEVVGADALPAENAKTNRK